MGKSIQIEITRGEMPLSNIPERWCTVCISPEETQIRHARALWVTWKGRKRWILIQGIHESRSQCLLPRVTLSKPDQQALEIEFNPREGTETKTQIMNRSKALILELWFIHSHVVYFVVLPLLA